MNRPSIADQLLIEAQPQEVREAFRRLYGDEETRAEELDGYRRKIRTETLSECRDTIRTWNEHQEADTGLTPKAFEDLINFI